jgi:hypothetical protein
MPRGPVFALATILLLSSSLVPSFAQNEGKPPTPSQPQTVPVQPERTPQQSEQSREQDKQRVDDTRLGPDWRVQRGGDRMGRMDREEMGRMMDSMRRDMDSDLVVVGECAPMMNARTGVIPTTTGFGVE